MRILILGMNYSPEVTGIAPYTTGLAEYLHERGHEVHVIAARPHFPQWRVWEDYRSLGKKTECLSGVLVHRTYVYVPAAPRKVLNRLLYDITFSISALWRALPLKQFGLVIAISPPVQLGLTGWFLARLHRAPLFFHIKDIVSQAAVGAGMLRKSSLLSHMARHVERFAYTRADAIGVICAAFERHLRNSKIPAGKIVFFPDYIDTKALQPSETRGHFRERHQVGPRDFLVMYSGGIAYKQGLDILVDAARVVSHLPRFRFLIIGEGPTKHDLTRKIAAENINNVRVLPLQPKEQLADQLSAADVLVLTQKRDVTDAVFPSKLLAYMACGRPIVAAASPQSETARFINHYRVGIVVPAEEPHSLAEALVYLAANPDQAAEFGANARHTVIRTFEKEAVLDKIVTFLENWPQMVAL